MPRAMWSGSISFGLVNIPVKMVTATRNNNISFHQLHEQSRCRVRQKLYCPGKDEEIKRSELVKGFEIAPDQYVIVKQEELDSLAPEAGRTIDILNFVNMESIDPIFYEKPYYLIPDQHAEKAYRLLVLAMSNVKKVAIAKFVMRNKEYLAALRPVGAAICMETMRFADEVVSADKLEGIPKDIEVGEKEIKMAEQLISTLSDDFEPAKYHDVYMEKLRNLLDKKAQGETVISEAAEPETKGRVIDLLAALEQSLAKSKKKNGKLEEKEDKRRLPRNKAAAK